MKDIRYIEPKTLKEACMLLYGYKENAKVIGGGTDLVVKLKRGMNSPKALISLKGIEGLEYINIDGDVLRVGALTRLCSIQQSQIIRDSVEILSQAAASVGSIQIRNVGTIGGNICLDSRCWYYNQSSDLKSCWPACYKDGGKCCYVVKGSKECYSIYSADTVPVLIALGAKIKISNPDAERVIPLEDFFTGTGQKVNILKAGEIVTEIEVPKPTFNSVGVYLKIRKRGAIDFPIVGVAALIDLSQQSKMCNKANIIYVGVGPTPVRAKSAEKILNGKQLTEALIEDASFEGVKDCAPISNVGQLAGYRREMIKVLTKRAVGQLMFSE